MVRSVSSVLLLCAVAGVAGAQQPALSAQPSTRATTVVNLMRQGQTEPAARISIDYGQPHLRGRPLDQLVRVGRDWRFGANAATTLQTGVDLMIGDLAVPAGTYTLFAHRGASGWQLVVNRQTGQWGTMHDTEQDLGRVNLTRTALHQPVESFTVWLIPASPQSGKASGELRFAWGTEQLSTTWSVR